MAFLPRMLGKDAAGAGADPFMRKSNFNRKIIYSGGAYA